MTNPLSFIAFWTLCGIVGTYFLYLVETEDSKEVSVTLESIGLCLLGVCIGFISLAFVILIYLEKYWKKELFVIKKNVDKS